MTDLRITDADLGTVRTPNAPTGGLLQVIAVLIALASLAGAWLTDASMQYLPMVVAGLFLSTGLFLWGDRMLNQAHPPRSA